MLEIIKNIDITQWVMTIGFAGVLFIVFAETGLFLGFFLPGDSLLFAAGVLAAKGFFSIGILIPSLIVTAVAGYALGYWFGAKLGHWLMRRNDSFWFKKKHLIKARDFYEKHGGKALILGRLLPIIRTFVPIVAGMTKMSYKKYSLYNVIGAIIWGGGITLLGYYLGTLLPSANRYLLPVIILIILISLIPAAFHLLRQRK